MAAEMSAAETCFPAEAKRALGEMAENVRRWRNRAHSQRHKTRRAQAAAARWKALALEAGDLFARGDYDTRPDQRARLLAFFDACDSERSSTPSPFVVLPQLTADEAAKVHEALDYVIITERVDPEGVLADLNPLRTAFAEAIANHQRG